MNGTADAASGSPASGRWLICGHGSVGSALVRRLVGHGLHPVVYDPQPRIPVAGVAHRTALAADDGTFERVISCVVPASAPDALAQASPALAPATLYLDWNTLPPERKRELADRAPCPFIDVALLDTLDEESAHPSLALSGPAADEAAAVLDAVGFHVDVVGPRAGDAAHLKLARSLFMKTLEALVVEFEAAVATLPGREVVTTSIERNLGPRFVDFSHMLLETDRVHAARRSRELEEAVEAYAEAGQAVRVASAAADTLRAAARVWAATDAPPPDAGRPALARFLAERLASTDGGRGAGR